MSCIKLFLNFGFSIKQFKQKSNFHSNSGRQNKYVTNLYESIRTKYADTSKLNKERETSGKNGGLGASAVLGVVGGAATLLFAGPIAATSIGTAVGVGIYNLGMAAARSTNREKLACKNTSNDTTKYVIHRD